MYRNRYRESQIAIVYVLVVLWLGRDSYAYFAATVILLLFFCVIAIVIVYVLVVLWGGRNSDAYLAAIPEIRPAVLSNPTHNCCFHLYPFCTYSSTSRSMHRDIRQCTVMPSMAKFTLDNCAICAFDPSSSQNTPLTFCRQL